jgi:hypothetical protein
VSNIRLSVKDGVDGSVGYSRKAYVALTVKPYVKKDGSDDEVAAKDRKYTVELTVPAGNRTASKA